MADAVQVDSHFLSATNPLATADQRDVEQRAIALTLTPAYQQARAATERRWRELAGSSPSEEAWGRFQTLIDECAFASLLKAVNGDPNYPRVVRIVMPPHEWFGMSVPGSRFGGGPGADQSYAIIPIEYGGRYQIQGRWIGVPPADHNYGIYPNAYYMNTLGTLHHEDLVVSDDGRFTLTVGPEAGASNHIRTKPGAQYLFIRCCRSDWRQSATALRVEALNAPKMPPWTDEQVLARAAQLALDDAAGMYYWVRLFENMPANVVSKPNLTSDRGLPSQTTSFARLLLEDDEAFVVTIDPAGALFHDVQLNDYWFGSIGDYYGRTGTLNNAQTKLGADGVATYVVSRRDPGVYNWLDPNGLRETLFVARWQRLPGAAGERTPAIEGKLVKLGELDAVLPADVARVSPQERRAQLAERWAHYQLRLEV